jgi:integrase
MNYKGVRIRDGKIQIKFKPPGQSDYCYKTLEGLSATPANMAKAARVREDIRLECKYGTFRWANHFPDDPRAKQLNAGTFMAFAKSWLENPEHHWTKRTEYKWRGILNRVWVPSLHEMPVAAITYDHISQALAEAIAEFVEEYGKEPSISTYNDWLTCVRGPFNQAVKSNALSIHANPCSQLSNKTRPNPLPDPFDIDEIQTIINAMYEREAVEHAAYVEFCFFSGVRSPNEATALLWEEVSLRNHEARICRKRTRHGVEDGSKTGNSRIIDLNPRSEHALRKMREVSGFKGQEVFVHKDRGTPIINAQPLQDAWRRTLKHADIRYRRMYNMRHSYACYFIGEQLLPAYLATQMGNSLQEFFKSYARWINKADKGRQAALMRESTPDWGETGSKPTLRIISD